MRNLEDPLTKENLDDFPEAQKACLRTRRKFNEFIELISTPTDGGEDLEKLKQCIRNFAESMPQWSITEAAYIAGWLTQLILGKKRD